MEVLVERVRPTATSRTRLLPVAAPFAPLLPGVGVQRGGVVRATPDSLSVMVCMSIGP